MQETIIQKIYEKVNDISERLAVVEANAVECTDHEVRLVKLEAASTYHANAWSRLADVLFKVGVAVGMAYLGMK